MLQPSPIPLTPVPISFASTKGLTLRSLCTTLRSCTTKCYNPLLLPTHPCKQYSLLPLKFSPWGPCVPLPDHACSPHPPEPAWWGCWHPSQCSYLFVLFYQITHRLSLCKRKQQETQLNKLIAGISVANIGRAFLSVNQRSSFIFLLWKFTLCLINWCNESEKIPLHEDDSCLGY